MTDSQKWMGTGRGRSNGSMSVGYGAVTDIILIVRPVPSSLIRSQIEYLSKIDIVAKQRKLL